MIGEKLGPYEILASIGSGGMGEVWKAKDTRLGRIVAIKKVKEQHSERFKREARSIAALNHPNICQIHDIGPDYLVLEYVEGKPLSSPLPEQETTRLAIQIATALEEAHQHGIIHRDLKPSNILVTDKGSVKLLDFGLAKLYEQDASISSLPTADMPETQAGAILGTVAYMSPEQAQGKPADARSDIFSFGLVLYEMLSGRKAFSGNSAPEIMAALLRDKPPPLQSSAPFENIVSRCLEKQPSARYQTISALKTELEKAFEDIQSKTPEEPQPSIAVLPFADMSPGKDNEWFSDGLAEEIINALTKVPGLLVIARTSAFAFRGKQEDIRKIAEVLGVANILEGSVRKAGNRIRVTAQLIEASKGGHLWSERYDRDMTDIFAIQDEISQAIAEKLRVSLLRDRPLVTRYTENVEAYNHYLKGRHQLAKFTAESMAKSKKYLEQAIEIDQNYALAWHGLAMYYWWVGYVGFMPSKEANVQCKMAATKALELDETLAEAHALMAMLMACGYDWKGAEREFLRAQELNPESADVLANYSQFYLLPLGRFDEAVALSQKALRLDPLSAHYHFHLGNRYYFMQQYDKTIEHCRNALEIDSQYHWAHMFVGVTHTMTGKHDEAVRACELAAQIVRRAPTTLAILGWVYAQAGRVSEAQKILVELQDLARSSYVPALSFAYTYLALGEVDRGFDSLEKAVEEHDFMAANFGVHPAFLELRSHPRYKALLRKMNLEP